MARKTFDIILIQCFPVSKKPSSVNFSTCVLKEKNNCLQTFAFNWTTFLYLHKHWRFSRFISSRASSFITTRGYEVSLRKHEFRKYEWYLDNVCKSAHPAYALQTVIKAIIDA